MSYTPPAAHNVILDFEQPITPADSHNLVLNFGDVKPKLSVLNAVIDTRIQAFIQGSNTEIMINHGYLLATINTSIQAEINGTNWENVDNRGTLLVVVDTSIQVGVTGINDINHIRGIEAHWITEYQRAKPCLIAPEIRWAKPIFKAHNSAFYFERILSLGNHASVGFDKANTLHRAVQIIHEQTTGLSRSAYLKWQENEKLFISRSLFFGESKNLKINRNTDWVELVRKSKRFTYSHQVAHVFEKHFTFEWDKGLELVTESEMPWEKARTVHYRKNPVAPWPEPEIPQYSGSTDLNFTCLCNDIDPHNVVLNFGADDCIPSIPNKEWWHILNSLSVTRLDNGEEIQVMDGSYSTDRSSWCWSYSLTVPASEIEKLNSIAGQPVILKILVNGNEHQMLLESRTRSRKFAQDTFNLSGRSQTALLDAPYSPTRSFLQENERTARQLCQAELDRVNSQVQLNWQLIDELSWILPINSLSYSNLTPIAVIKMIAESAGGFVYSEKNSNTLTIKPKYKKTFWDSIAVSDYDRLIPLSITVSQSIDDVLYPDYNGITLTNDRNGLTGQVRRTGTSADTLQETTNNPLFTFESMGGYGKSVLAKAGMVETHALLMPVESEVGECAPGELVAFDAEWWGISDSVAVSLTHAIVNQTIKVERVNHE